jgi:iron complex transport system substrate-binding protein
VPGLARPSARRLAAALTLLAALPACGAQGRDADAAGSTEHTGGRTVDDCGVAVPIGDPPERIFAVFHNAVELAHALGMSDRLVGTAYLDNPILPDYADAQAATRYYETIPSREEMLTRRPDFVISGFTGTFTPEAFGTRAELADIGIRTWLSRALCPTEDGAGQDDLAVDHVPLAMIYDEILDLGAVFDQTERAERLVDDMRREIDRVSAALAHVDDRPRVAVVNLPDGGQYRVFGGGDIVETIIRAAGGEPIFADVPGRVERIGIEEVIARDPEVIFVPACCGADVGPDAAQDVIDGMLAEPALANVAAVRHRRIYPVTFAEMSPGIRVADAIHNVARHLHPDAFTN